MIAEDLSLKVSFSSRSIVKSTCEDVNDRRFKENRCFFVNFSDSIPYLLVSWQQVFVVRLARKQSISRGVENIRANGLIDELITYEIRFVGQICSNNLPKFRQMIEETPLVGENIFLKSHHVFSHVVFCELYLQAVFNERVSLVIVAQFYLQREGEVLSLRNPHWQPLPAELFGEEILMSIQEDRDAEFITFLQYFPESLDVGVVVDSSLRLYSLPGGMESDGIHAPMLEIIQIFISEAVVAGEFYKIGVEGMGFVHSIDSVKHSVSVVLVNKEGIVRIHSDGLNQGYENCKDQHF